MDFSLADIASVFPPVKAGRSLAQLVPEPTRDAILSELGKTWPAKMAQSAYGAMTLPGDVYAGRTDSSSDEAIGRSANLAGLMMLGATAAPAGALGSGLVRRPYQGVPDSLMGFRRNGVQKGFDEENFKHVQPVRVTLDNGDVFEDAIRGLNKAHALERARRNWEPSAIIEPIEGK